LQRIAGPVAELSIARCKILFHSLRRRRTRGRVKLEADAVGTSHNRATLEFAQKFFRPANDLSGIKRGDFENRCGTSISQPAPERNNRIGARWYNGVGRSGFCANHNMLKTVRLRERRRGAANSWHALDFFD